MRAISGRSRKLAAVLATAVTALLAASAFKDNRVRASRPRAAHGVLEIAGFAGDGNTPLTTHVRVRPARLFADDQDRLARDGRVRLSLPEGAYHVTVSHGPEWSLVTRTVQVVAGETQALRAILRRELHADDLIACDLHVHTDESPDSRIGADERMLSLNAEDVAFAAITNHNRVTHLKPQRAVRAAALVPGVEVTTWAPEFGHFNVFPRRTAPRYRATTPSRLSRELRREPGSFVQINHPRLEDHIGHFAHLDLSQIGRRGADTPPMLAAADAIEVWNGYDLGRPARRDEVFRDWQSLLARGLRLTATGNSDSHGMRPPYVGYPRTVVQVPRRHAADTARVVAALKAGRSFVTSGPILRVAVESKPPGESVWLGPATRSVQLRVQVSTPRWMNVNELEVYVGGARTFSATLPARSRAGVQHLTIALPVRAPAALVVVVKGPPGMKEYFGKRVEPYAFSNPVWLRADARSAK